MAKIESTRTELVRAGKYNEDEMLKGDPRVNLSFELIERVNMSAPRACRGAGALARSQVYPPLVGLSASGGLPIGQDDSKLCVSVARA